MLSCVATDLWRVCSGCHRNRQHQGGVYLNSSQITAVICAAAQWDLLSLSATLDYSKAEFTPCSALSPHFAPIWTFGITLVSKGNLPIFHLEFPTKTTNYVNEQPSSVSSAVYIDFPAPQLYSIELHLRSLGTDGKTFSINGFHCVGDSQRNKAAFLLL